MPGQRRYGGHLDIRRECRRFEIYLAVFKLLERRNKELAEASDELRRSTAWRQLAEVRSRGLLTDEQFARFSPETQGAVQVWLGA